MNATIKQIFKLVEKVAVKLIVLQHSEESAQEYALLNGKRK